MGFVIRATGGRVILIHVAKQNGYESCLLFSPEERSAKNVSKENVRGMQDDTISRQAAIDALCNDYCGGHQDCKYYPNCENLRSVQKLPSAQPERARGTWMPDTMCYYEERFICSECKGNYKVDTCMGKPMWNFCPNCGADMRGEQDG